MGWGGVWGREGVYDGRKKSEINCLFKGSAEPFCCGGDLSFISSLKSLQRLERQRTCQQTSVYKAGERGGEEGEGREGGDRRERGSGKGTGRKGFRESQANRVWGHEWVERSREAVEEVMEG